MARTPQEARRLAVQRYGEEVLLRQDEDVLDTWFRYVYSSRTWHFNFMCIVQISRVCVRIYLA